MGARLLATRGLILAGTKLEFGVTGDGALVLGDEVLTPDSSRLWPADTRRPGERPRSFDRQFIRDWAASTGWCGDPPAPYMPDRIVTEARGRYVTAYERITGQRWSPPVWCACAAAHDRCCRLYRGFRGACGWSPAGAGRASADLC